MYDFKNINWISYKNIENINNTNSTNKNINWKTNNTCDVTHIYINYNYNKIYKKYKDKSVVIKLKNTYKKINTFDFIPKMEFFEEENIIVEDYYKHRLGILNKPYNYIFQLIRIHKIIKKNNLHHNDYQIHHFYVSNNKIKLIDWGLCSENAKYYKGIINVKYALLYLILYYSLDKIILLILSFVLLYYLCNKNRKNINNLIIK